MRAFFEMLAGSPRCRRGPPVVAPLRKSWVECELLHARDGCGKLCCLWLSATCQSSLIGRRAMRAIISFQNHFHDPDGDLCRHLGSGLPGRLPPVRRRLLPRLTSNLDERLGQRRRSCASIFGCNSGSRGGSAPGGAFLSEAQRRSARRHTPGIGIHSEESADHVDDARFDPTTSIRTGSISFRSASPKRTTLAIPCARLAASSCSKSSSARDRPRRGSASISDGCSRVAPTTTMS